MTESEHIPLSNVSLPSDLPQDLTNRALPDELPALLTQSLTPQHALSLLRGIHPAAVTAGGVTLGYLGAVHIHALRAVIEHGADINRIGLNGKAPIHRVCADVKFGPEMLTLLIKAGADVNVKDELGQGPLFNAVRMALVNPLSGIRVVHKLIDAGARCDDPDSSGETAIRLARKLSLPQISSIFRELMLHAPTLTGRQYRKP